MTTRFPRRAMACALLATSALVSVPAIAQVSGPPAYRNFDANGVDLVRGDYLLTFTEGSIGSGPAELALARTAGSAASGASQWDGISLQLTRTHAGGPETVTVNLGNHAERFTGSGGSYSSSISLGSTLSGGGSNFVYTMHDGTQITFSDPSGNPQFGATNFCKDNTQLSCTLLPTEMATPDGKAVTLGWTLNERCATEFNPDGSLDCEYDSRLGSVSNNYGYSIAFTYSTDIASGVPTTAWYQRTGAGFYNASISGSPQANVSYSYPSNGVTNVTDTGGRVWVVSAGAIRRPGAGSDTTMVTTNGSGTVTQVTREGVTTGYSRSVSGTTATTTVTDALSHVTTVVSDLNISRPTSITDPLSRTTAFQYDSLGRLTQRTEPEGNASQYSYDSRSNVTQVRRVAKTGSGLADIVATASFDATCANPVTCNEPNSITDAKGNETDYTYDSTHGGVLSVTRPAPTSGATRPETRFSYTLADGIYQLTGVSACQTGSAPSCVGTSDEVKSTIAYDANGNVTSVSSGDGTGSLTATTAMTYDAIGNLLTVDGPLAGSADTTRYRYDAARELIGVTGPDPDGAGSLKMAAVRNTYTNALLTKREIGTVNSQSDSDWAAFSPAEAVDITYDANARPLTQKLSSGGTNYALSQFSYDSLGRSDCVALRMNPAVYGSLPSSACTLGTAGSFGNDRITQTVYDNASEPTQLKVAVGTSDAATERTLTYSNNGKLATLLDGENNLTTYEYDGFDRLSKTRYPNTTKGSGTSSTTDYEQLGYDANSNVTSRRLRDGNSIAFTYDNLNRVTFKDLPGSEPDVTIAYDNLGRPTSVSQSGNSLSLTYDALSRQLTETGPQGTATSAYDLAGNRTSLAYPGSGLTVNTDYLVNGAVSAIRENGATSGVGVLASYGYDNLGRRTSVTFGNGASQAFTYDAVSRLASLTNDLAGTTNDLSATFSYNPASQIAGTVRTGDAYAFRGDADTNTSSSQNGLNQQVSIGGSSATWDSKGNITSEPLSGRTYGYSSENLLTSASGSVTLGYDPAMRLYQVAGAATTRFAYDGLDAIAEYDGSNALQRRFVFAPGIDQPIVQYEGTGTTSRRFLSSDERGSIVSATDSSGTLIGINTYDEYGKPGSANVGRFQYTGQKWIGEIGGYDYKARIYLPQVPTFAQLDPIWPASGSNGYDPMGGDPVDRTDPTGLDDKSGTEAGAAGKELDPEIIIFGLEPHASTGGAGPSRLLSTFPGTRNGDDFGDPIGKVDPEEILVIGTKPQPQTRTFHFAQWQAFPWGDLIHFPIPMPLDGNCACFEAGTLVATPTGLKPIEQIMVGDLVLSEDEQTGKIAAKKVAALIRPKPKPIYELELRDVSGALEKFHVTADHRWLVDAKGWTATAELKIGERIETDSRRDVTVTSVSLTNIVERTYNLEVSDWHTFMVGKDHAVVHNGCPAGIQFPTDPSQLGHIFRKAPGHFSKDTANARQLIMSAINPDYFTGTDKFGVDQYRMTLANGAEVWVQVYNNIISNAGITLPR
jgi:RHS repeat-associated protein